VSWAADRRRRRSTAGVGLLVLVGVVLAIGVAGCGGSTVGLIPSADASSLKQDFEAVARAAESGNGACAKTEAALQQTVTDFGALPTGLKRALHQRLQEGIDNLRERALAKCAEVTSTTTTTSTTKTTTSQPVVVITTTSSTASPVITPPATTTTPSESNNGGAAAPQEESGEGGAEGPEPETGGAGGGGGR